MLDELGTGTLCDGRPGFFAPGQLRFGTPLERSELEAAVQRAHGVDGVVLTDYRRRGYVPDFVPMPEVVTVGRDEIIRVDNDPSRPDRGSIRVVVRGGQMSCQCGCGGACGELPTKFPITNPSGLRAARLPGRHVRHIPPRAAAAPAPARPSWTSGGLPRAATSACRCSTGGPTSPTS